MRGSIGCWVHLAGRAASLFSFSDFAVLFLKSCKPLKVKSVVVALVTKLKELVRMAGNCQGYVWAVLLAQFHRAKRS